MNDDISEDAAMSDMQAAIHQIPSRKKLFKATGLALVVAAVILVLAVLPAEYGVDPTGAGERLGLTQLNNADRQDGEGETVDLQSAVTVGGLAPVTITESAVLFTNSELTLELEAFEGAEIKALMKADDLFVFSWESTDGTKVYVDMHGEKPAAKEGDFTRYRKEQQHVSQGAFVAPFDGTHGWYWQNMTEEVVTIKLKVSGYYEKLFRP